MLLRYSINESMKTKNVQTKFFLATFIALFAFAAFSTVSAQEDVPVETQNEESVELISEIVSEPEVVDTADDEMEPEQDEPKVEEVAKENVEQIKTKSISEKKTGRGILVVQNFDGQIKTLQNVSGRLANKIIEMNDAGLATGGAKQLIEKGNNSLRSAFGELKKMKEQMNRIRATEQYEEGTVESFRQTLSSVRKNLTVTRDLYRQALEILKKSSL